MADAARFQQISAGLAEGVRRTDGLVGLVLLGSASDEGAERRDEWSDHDFFALIEPGRGAELRRSLDWLPDPERIVAVGREGSVGRAVIYDDGHVLEFALAEVAELDGALAGAATVVLDDADGSVAGLIEASRARVSGRLDPANDIRLMLVKLLIGVGRARRGELLAAGHLVRTWAVDHLVRTVRGRLGDPASAARDAIDPLRRFEVDFPDLGAEIAALQAADLETAARGLLDLARRELEPGWSQFPTAAADAVAIRLGYPPQA